MRTQKHPTNISGDAKDEPTDFPQLLLYAMREISHAPNQDLEMMHINRLKNFVAHKFDGPFGTKYAKIRKGIDAQMAIINTKYRAKKGEFANRQRKVEVRDINYQASQDLHRELMRLMSRKNLLGEKQTPLFFARDEDEEVPGGKK